MLVARSRRKIFNLTLMLFAGLLVAAILSEDWYDRISSVAEYERDRSAQGRLDAWTVATKLAVDSPITGGGFRTLQPEIYQRYGFPSVKKELVAHSIFFQVLSDHGFVGLGIFIALLASTLVSLQRVTRMTPRTSARSELAGLAQAIQTGLIAFVASGAFLSQAYFDLVYHLIAIGAILPNLCEEEATTVAETLEEEAAPNRLPVVVRPG